MEVNTDNKKKLASFLEAGLNNPRVNLVKELVDRMWIHFEWDPKTEIWNAIPSGLALIGFYVRPEILVVPFYKEFVKCGWSYEDAGEKITGIPGELMTQCNRVFGRGQLKIDEIIFNLSNNIPLEEEGVGPIIIDRMSDPGA